MRRPYVSIVLGLTLTACANEPEFALSPATMDCEQGSCLVTFSITNASAEHLPLVYDVTLSQNPIGGPTRSGLIVVGTADGELNLPPNETRTVELEVEVTETPAVSKISVFDARTPDLIRQLLES